MTTETTSAKMVKLRSIADWIREQSLATLALLLVLGVAAAGWSGSFIGLHSFAIAHMGFSSRAAWLVPATFDGAALGLSLLAFRAATYGRASLGARGFVYGFTALSSWINYIHITDARGRLVACLLPISAVLVFDKVLREAREAYERRNGKVVFRIRPGLLMLRLMTDRKATAAEIRAQIKAIPVEALIGMGAGTLARDAAAELADQAAERDSGQTAVDVARDSASEWDAFERDLSRDTATETKPAVTRDQPSRDRVTGARDVTGNERDGRVPPQRDRTAVDAPSDVTLARLDQAPAAVATSPRDTGDNGADRPVDRDNVVPIGVAPTSVTDVVRQVFRPEWDTATIAAIVNEARPGAEPATIRKAVSRVRREHTARHASGRDTGTGGAYL